MFSLGCILYYVITGAHPFGTRFERESNIINNRFISSSDCLEIRVVYFYAYSGNLTQSDMLRITGRRLKR